MIRFLDGPAMGLSLKLARVPHYLRVVVSGGRGWDALDQIGDTPCDDEQIYLYVLARNNGVVHMDFRDTTTGKRRGETMQSADYRVHTDPPTDSILRHYKAYEQWCYNHLPEGMQEPTKKEV